jgi:hypothetical protein
MAKCLVVYSGPTFPAFHGTACELEADHADATYADVYKDPAVQTLMALLPPSMLPSEKTAVWNRRKHIGIAGGRPLRWFTDEQKKANTEWKKQEEERLRAAVVPQVFGLVAEPITDHEFLPGPIYKHICDCKVVGINSRSETCCRSKAEHAK